jgi:tetratricopeptide (TPR) repeat protein
MHDRLWNSKFLVAHGLFLLASALYIWGLAPTIYWRDSPEFIAAVHLLGISHPAGSPTYALLAKPLTFLPLGSIALRVNLFSSLCGALVISLLFALLYELFTESPSWARFGAAVSGALFLLVSESFWRFSEVAEVYTLQDCLLVMLIALLVKTRTARTSAPPTHLAVYWLFAFLYGLSAGVHATMAFCVPAFLAFIGLTEPRMLRGKELAFLAFFFLLGFASYLYLPLRSLREPALDWGDTETFRQFLIHITDRKDAATHFELPWPKLPSQVHLYLAHVSNEFSTLGFALGVSGCIYLFFRDKPVWLLLLLVFLGNVGFFIRSWKSAFGFLPSFVIFAIWIGFGVQACLRLLTTLYQQHNIRISRLVVPLCLFGGMVITLSQTFSRHIAVANQTGNYSTELYGKQLLEQLPSDAIFFSDYAWFPLLYLQHVERRRPDLTLLLQNEIFFPSLFAFLSKARVPNIMLGTSSEPVRMSPVEYFWRLCMMNQKDHPLFWDADRELQSMFDKYLLPEGLLFAFTPGREIDITPQVLQTHQDLLAHSTHRILHGTLDTEGYDFLSGKINLIGLYFRRRDLDTAAAEMYRAGLSLQPDSFDLRNNYGGALLSQRRFLDALEQFNVAYNEEPGNPVVNKNLGLLLLKGKEYTQAAHFFERALFFGSAQWDVYTLLGETYLRLGRVAAAERALQSARTLFEASQAQHDVGALALGDIYAQLGEAYVRLSRFSEATQALQSALKLYEESTASQDIEDRRHTMTTWARENLYRLDQGVTTNLLPHPLLTPASPSAK